MKENWRNNHSILVTEAHAIGSLAVIRSLGRAGYRVIATSPLEDALGFSSSYCHASYQQPSYDNPEEFITWLNKILKQEHIDVVIPSEAFLLVIRPWFQHFQHILPTPKSQRLVYQALSKCDLFQASIEGGFQEHLPPFALLGEEDALPSEDELHLLGEPLFLKVDAVYARDESPGDVVKCQTSRIAREQLKSLRQRYQKVLIQGYVPGTGVGVFFAQWQGNTLGEFMHRRVHEVPHTGGVSSLRSAWKHQAILADAKRRATHLGWEGVGMFEYRWNPGSDTFSLMEFNSRFWGSLHLALFAGIDFPRLLVDAIFGHVEPPVTDYPLIQCRLTFPREVEYVFSCLKDPSFSIVKKLSICLEFGMLGINPKMFSDLNFPGDRALYIKMMVHSLRRFMS
ncbi:MAG: hypothetical protein NPIRA02_14900 [Nitrospirales bacterium]|nr:MAG: hypothetical protein NPIRA02_14900 [Nitrospirales bacterium]